MTIIEKPRARQENGIWLVYCSRFGPAMGKSLDEAYLAWARRRGIA